MNRLQPYADRAEAGRLLAEEVVGALEAAPDHDHRTDSEHRSDHDHRPGPERLDHDHRLPLVLALPRGGVPIAGPVAEALGVPVSVLVVRKLGAPGQPELAVGAVALIGDRVERVLNTDWVRRIGLSSHQLDAIVAAETRQLQERALIFGATPAVAGRTVIIVDDGLATGATMKVAVTAVRAAGASYVVAAAPVGAVGACRDLADLADQVVCPRRPDPFRAVGEHYRDFAQVEDAEVLALLGRS